MNRIARATVTAAALALVMTTSGGVAHAQRPNDSGSHRTQVSGNSCSAHPYTFACWQGPRRPDGGPAYRIHTGISPL